MTLGAFCVIRDEQGKVLLCHRRDRDLWNLPGGRVEDGEAPWEAAVRETKEEILLDVEIEKPIGCYYKNTLDEVVFMFEARPKGDLNFSETSEADEVAFFDVPALPDNTSERQKRRLQACFEKTASWPLMETELE